VVALKYANRNQRIRIRGDKCAESGEATSIFDKHMKQGGIVSRISAPSSLGSSHATVKDVQKDLI
jgi:hypothetical protein